MVKKVILLFLFWIFKSKNTFTNFVYNPSKQNWEYSKKNGTANDFVPFAAFLQQEKVEIVYFEKEHCCIRWMCTEIHDWNH